VAADLGRRAVLQRAGRHTRELLADAITEDEPFRVVACGPVGKIGQLNAVLPELRGEIIVNTDVDARLAPDALRWIAAEFAASESVSVVGAYCRPEGPLALERYYWDQQNKGRFLESDAGAASIVVAPCYAFRRTLLTAFPDDVVADDIYVAFLAHAERCGVVYSRKAMAVETRSPRGVSEFLPHKFRKSNAFLRESLRFLYRLPEMTGLGKTLLLVRTAQQLLLPWLLLFWLLTAGAILTLFRFDLVLFGAAFLFVLFGTTSVVFAGTRLPEPPRRYSLVTVAVGYVLTNFILMVTALSYPFFRQGSTYARLDGGAKAVPEDRS
jgi:cellulose synthase/poly-beta-1,6-N-acetylglucosamine synthase-like glycosyltransferase